MTLGGPIDYTDSLRVVSAVNYDLAEGPFWDSSTNKLIFVDCNRGHINQLDPVSGSLSRSELGQTVGVAIPCKSGGFAVTSSEGLLFYQEKDDASLIVPIESGLPNNRMNDGKCDSRGRLWSGTFSTSFRRGAGNLYRIDPDLSLTKAVSGIRVSNGIAWNEDETLMYFNDTLSGGIDVFDYDIDQGVISNRRRFVDIERDQGLPDGLTVDKNGCVWVALFYGYMIRRYNPKGDLVGVIKLPTGRVTSCNFGGSDLMDLYITTADFTLHDDSRPHEQEGGYIFTCRPGVSGLPSYHFGK